MWRMISLALLLGHVLGLDVAAADDKPLTCAEIKTAKSQALSDWAKAHGTCLDGEATNSDDACELAQILAAEYHRLSIEHTRRCVPQLRSE